MTMQPSSSGSFIPKKSLQRVERARGRKRVYVLTYVAYSIFFATLLTVGFTLLYNQYLKSQLNERISELDAQRAQFDQSKVAYIKEVERKLRVSEYLFGQHASVFRLLQEVERFAVADNVFTAFSYEVLPGNVTEISLVGHTAQFNRVAFQQEVLEDASVLRKGTLKQLAKNDDQSDAKDETGELQTSIERLLPVVFTLHALVSPTDIGFAVADYDLTFMPTNAVASSSVDAEAEAADMSMTEVVADDDEVANQATE